MNKKDFESLTLKQKGDVVFNKGTHLAIRYYYNHTVNLYSLDDLFIEVFYFPPENKITKIEILEGEQTLNLYIDNMNRK